MRDSDLLPLSITYRQYDTLMRLIEALENPELLIGQRLNTPIARRIAEGNQIQKLVAPIREQVLGRKR
jgi:hypothetical protein